jgi:hypothetical protein
LRNISQKHFTYCGLTGLEIGEFGLDPESGRKGETFFEGWLRRDSRLFHRIILKFEKPVFAGKVFYWGNFSQTFLDTNINKPLPRVFLKLAKIQRREARVRLSPEKTA